MHPFSYIEASSPEAAHQAFPSERKGAFFAGGTTLIDLMKLDVVTPEVLVDVNHLPFSRITETSDGVSIGANVRNSDLAHDSLIRERYPVLSEALLSGASAQLRNMATTAGNLLQRTRCPYFRDVHARCNKRIPGSGCDALEGVNRSHAILGTSEHCIATHPSDMCVALTALEAVIHTERADGTKRSIPIDGFYLLPGDTPDRENVLEAGELITHVTLPNNPLASRSHYLKVRDRASYEFALASAAVMVQVQGDRIAAARVAFGGIGTIPWRSREAESALLGKPVSEASFQDAAEAALRGAVPREHNAFKVELAKRTLVEALAEVTR